MKYIILLQLYLINQKKIYQKIIYDVIISYVWVYWFKGVFITQGTVYLQAKILGKSSYINIRFTLFIVNINKSKKTFFDVNKINDKLVNIFALDFYNNFASQNACIYIKSSYADTSNNWTK